MLDIYLCVGLGLVLWISRLWTWSVWRCLRWVNELFFELPRNLIMPQIFTREVARMLNGWNAEHIWQNADVLNADSSSTCFWTEYQLRAWAGIKLYSL